MKYIAHDESLGMPVVEMTRRNLEVLLRKLDDPASLCTLIAPENGIAIRAVEDAVHYKTRHPGVVYMPSTGETL